MRRAPLLLALLLTACGQQQGQNLVEADPMRLKALRAQCAAHRQAVGEEACQAAAEAFRRRFFAGLAPSDEYQTLDELPPIPPSFDAPAVEDSP